MVKKKYNKLSVRKYLEKYVRDQKPWYNIHCKEEYIQVTIPPHPVNEEIETDEEMSERQVEQAINEIKGYMGTFGVGTEFDYALYGDNIKIKFNVR
jgi:ribosomal protein S3AE